MWEFWLASSEMCFRHVGLMVFQLQLARNMDATPITRDCMVDRKRLDMGEATAVLKDG